MNRRYRCEIFLRRNKSRKDYKNADSLKITIIIIRLTLCNSTYRRRWPRHRLLPQSTVTQSFFIRSRLTLFDKTDDPHLSATLRAAQRVHRVHLLNHCRPTCATLLFERTSLCILSTRLGLRRRLSFLAHAALFIRIPAPIVDQVLPLVRYMLRHLRQEFQCIKNLKIARHAFPEPLISGPRKPHAFAFTGTADHLCPSSVTLIIRASEKGQHDS